MTPGDMVTVKPGLVQGVIMRDELATLGGVGGPFGYMFWGMDVAIVVALSERGDFGPEALVIARGGCGWVFCAEVSEIW